MGFSVLSVVVALVVYTAPTVIGVILLTRTRETRNQLRHVRDSLKQLERQMAAINPSAAPGSGP